MDFLLSLSLANLLCLSIWAIFLNSGNAYFLERPPCPANFAAAFINFGALTALLWGSSHLVRNVASPRLARLAQLSFLVAVLLALNGVRFLTGALPLSRFSGPLGGIALFIFCTSVAAIGSYLLLKKRTELLFAVKLLVLALLPGVAVTAGRSIWMIVDPQVAPFQSESPAPRLAPGRISNATRVLWIVFDEWDYRLAFSDRPESVKLPEIDRILEESFQSSNAYPPGRRTDGSMPGLILGRRVEDVYPAGPKSLMLRFAGSRQFVSWASQQNVFSRARNLGVNSGLVGWYHPYCRVIGADLASCSWHPYVSDDRSEGVGIRVWRQWVRFLNCVPFAFRLGVDRLVGLDSQYYVSTALKGALYQEVLNDALSLLRDDTLGLLMVHLPVPHGPWIYDRQVGRLSWGGHETYLDNLVLADRALGEMRSSMETDGSWERTVLILTSDHGYQKGAPMHSKWLNSEAPQLTGVGDARVPLIIRIPRGGGVTYAKEFNTARLHDLVLEILRGNIHKAVDIVSWLDRA